MKSMKIWPLLIIIGLSFGINSAMAAEKFNLCVYDISFGVKGASIESGSRIEKMATDYFKARPDIKVISKKDFKSYISNKLKVKKAGEKEVLDIAKFAGLDLLVFLKASGNLPGDVSLEDLFGEENAGNIKVNIKIYDVYQGEAVLEEESMTTNLSEAKKSIGDMLSKFDFPIKRGKVKRIEDNKVAVNIGLDDGIDAGQSISIFKAESKIKIGSSEIIPVGDKLAEGTVEKAIDAMSLIALNETAEVRVGDYAEAIIGEQGSNPQQAGVARTNGPIDKLIADQGHFTIGLGWAGNEFLGTLVRNDLGYPKCAYGLNNWLGFSYTWIYGAPDDDQIIAAANEVLKERGKEGTVSDVELKTLIKQKLNVGPYTYFRLGTVYLVVPFVAQYGWMLPMGDVGRFQFALGLPILLNVGINFDI